MTFIIYQEATNYCLERDNTVYTCFLDASKAFDMTWIDSLIYKLLSFRLHQKASYDI